MNVLEVKNVKKHFGGVQALTGCSLSVKKNSITGLIGPNGCGKSTLFNVINSLVRQDEGIVLIDGEDVSFSPAQDVARKGVTRTFQYPTLFKNLTIQDHIEMALTSTDERFFASFFRKRGGYTQRVKEVLALVGLDKPLDTLGSDLSYGQRKLLDLAIAVAQPHKIILLDEPVAGINPKLRVEIKKILRNLRDEGETLLVIEHDMNFIMDLADHIFVMENGRVLVDGKPKKIRNDKRVLEAYLGE